jgi:hypothetical protein
MGRQERACAPFSHKVFDLIGEIVKGLRGIGIGAEHSKGLSGVTVGRDVGIQGDAYEERHSHIFRRRFPAAFFEYLDLFMAMGA